MGDMIEIIGTIFVGISALPWLLVAFDLLAPERKVWSQFLKMVNNGSGVFSTGGASLLLAIAFFLGSGVFVMADKFFNDPWLSVRSDDEIRGGSYESQYGAVYRAMYPLELQAPVAELYSHGQRWQAHKKAKDLLKDKKGKNDDERERLAAEEKVLKKNLKRLEESAVKPIYDFQKFYALANPQGARLLNDVKQQLIVLRGGAWNLLMLFLVCLYGTLCAIGNPWLRRLSLAVPAGIACYFMYWTWGKRLPFLGIPLIAIAIVGVRALGWHPERVWPRYWTACSFTALLLLLSLSGYEAMEEEYNKHVVLFYQSSNWEAAPHPGRAVAPEGLPLQATRTMED